MKAVRPEFSTASTLETVEPRPVAGTPDARMVGFLPGDRVLQFRCLVDRQLEVRDSPFVPAGPGRGFGFDGAAVARHAVGSRA